MKTKIKDLWVKAEIKVIKMLLKVYGYAYTDVYYEPAKNIYRIKM